MREFIVDLPYGRILEALETGDPNGLPVFFLHGSPGSRTFYAPQVKDAIDLGIRLISYNRPGYGNSTRHIGRKIVDAASDVAAIADDLAIGRFAVWGHSGGGGHALACAAVFPKRVVAATSLAGVAPFNSKGLDFFSGMGEYNVQDFTLLTKDEKRWEDNNLQDTAMMASASKEELLQVLSTLLSEVDLNAVTDELFNYLRVGVQEGCLKGVNGLKDDNLAILSPWGFDPASIRVPTQIWHGGEDKFVPFAHGQWLADKIPHTKAHLEKGEGHLSLFKRRNREIQEWLISKF